MKTVKEFKDAGLEFVEGDEFYHEANKETAKFLCIIPSGQPFAGEVNIEYADGDDGIHNVDDPQEDMTVTKFAWRTNTGEQPSFDGVVEVELRSGRVSRDRISGFGWWLDGDDTDIIKWRPVISDEGKMEGKTNNPRVSERKDIPERNPGIKIISNASDCDVTIGKPEPEGFNCRSAMAEFKPSKQGPIPGDRQRFNGKEFVLTNIEVRGQAWTPIENLKQEPVFTKEMHEAGELPPVGSMFSVEPNVSVSMKCLYSSKFCVIGLLDSGLECVFDLHRPDVKYGFKPIDTRTEEEKLIDQACAEMLTIDDTPLDTSEKSIIEQMIKAGYRKP